MIIWTVMKCLWIPTCIVWVGLVCSCFAVAPWQESIVLESMHRVNDDQQAHPWKAHDRNWIRGTYYTGVMAFYKATQDQALLIQALAWARTLGDNAVAVVVLNRSEQAADISVPWHEIGVTDTCYARVRDLWAQQDLGQCCGGYHTEVPLHGSAFLRVTPIYLPNESNEDIVVIRPEEYEHALPNPLKGFTNRGFREDNEWATLVHSYIRWNQIENHESDDIDKIRQWCDTEWHGVSQRDQKVIPRVYLHWSGGQKYWPADMDPDDYTSEQFVQRVTRLVERLGIRWDTDPRVAHIEMGIIGKWGEHHSPSPTPEIERVLGDAFTAAFSHKRVLVRHPWREFVDYEFGAYWDSWAHASQMSSHGAGLASLTDRWRTNIIGGEVAYDWGRYKEQPGDSPTDTVSDPVHRDFLIDTIRSLHCMQLRWVADYDQTDLVARDGLMIRVKTKHSGTFHRCSQKSMNW